MFPRSIGPLFFLAPLLLIVIGPSTSRPLSRRETASRVVARSSSNPSPSSHQRRSLDDDDISSSLIPLDAFSLVDGDSINIRRSIHIDSDETQSIDEEKDEAEKEWEQFVAATSGEDSDSDSTAEDDKPGASCPTDNVVSHDAPKNTPSLVTFTDTGNGNSLQSPGAPESKPHKSKDSPPAEKNDVGASKKPDASQDKEAEAAKHREAEAAKQQQVEAEKEKKAEADKQKKAEADKQKKAEADKQKEDQVAQAKRDAEQAKEAEDAKKKLADQDGNQLTDLKPIPGTPVITGTVHKDHSDDSYSTPSSDDHSGDATFYTPDLGACGNVNKSNEKIVAVSHLLYDSFPSEGGNPNTNKVCGKKIRAHYKGRSVEVTVVDRCTGCAHDSLDFSITAFKELGTEEEGRLHGMTWTFI